jgi:hypothetical protein
MVFSSRSWTTISGCLARKSRKLRQQTGGGAVDGANPQPPRSTRARAVAKAVLDGFDPRQDRPGIAQQRGAVLRQRDRAGGSGKQTRAEVLFEQPDVAPERRRQHLQLLRRPAEMQLLRRRDETSELVQLHVELLVSEVRLYHFFV